MSTRSCIYVRGTDPDGEIRAVRLYRHCDGYPSSALHELSAAVRAAPGPGASALAGSITSLGYAREDGPSPRWLDAKGDVSKILSYQSDLEWVYVLDADAKNALVYGKSGIYSATSAEQIARGRQEPMAEVSEILPDYVDATRGQIKAAVAAIAASGWKVNEQSRFSVELEAACQKAWDKEQALDWVAEGAPSGARVDFPDPCEPGRASGEVVRSKAGCALLKEDGPDGPAWSAHDLSSTRLRPAVGDRISVEYVQDGPPKASMIAQALSR